MKITLEILKQLQRESLEHWNRMRECVLMRPLDDLKDWYVLEDEIGEVWGGRDCSYCIYFYNVCEECPLGLDNEDFCCNRLFTKIHMAQTWFEWLQACDLIIEYIKLNGLRRK